MKNKFVLSLMGLVMAGLLVLVVKQSRDLKRLSGQAEPAPTPDSVQKPPDAVMPKPPTARPDKPARDASVASVPQPPAAMPPAATPGPMGGATNFMAALAGLVKDPAMKEFMKSQQATQLEMLYGSLFQYLKNRPGVDLEKFKSLLLDRQMAMMDIGLSMMDGSTDKEAKAKDLKALRDSYDKQIADMLGPEDNAVFQEFENTQPERTQIQMFKQTFANSEPLSEQQEHDLIRAMYDERKKLPENALFNQKNPDPNLFTPEKMEETIKQMDVLYKGYSDSAATILSPTQLEQFKKFQDQQRAMSSVGMKFAAGLMGGQKPASEAKPTAVPAAP